MQAGLSILQGFVPLGFININGHFLRCGALYQGGAEDSVYLPVLDECVVCLTVLWSEFRCTLISESCLGLRMNSQRYLINQILEMPSEGATVDCEMAHPVMKGIVIPESRSLRIL